MEMKMKMKMEEGKRRKIYNFLKTFPLSLLILLSFMPNFLETFFFHLNSCFTCDLCYDNKGKDPENFSDQFHSQLLEKKLNETLWHQKSKKSFRRQTGATMFCFFVHLVGESEKEEDVLLQSWNSIMAFLKIFGSSLKSVQALNLTCQWNLWKENSLSRGKVFWMESKFIPPTDYKVSESMPPGTET